MANPPNIRLRGNRFSMPAGYILGRSKGGKGPPQLINLQTLASQVAIAGGGSSGGVTPGSGIELTDGTHDLTGVAKITVTGATVGGSSPNATLKINLGSAPNGMLPLVTGDIPGPIPI